MTSTAAPTPIKSNTSVVAHQKKAEQLLQIADAVEQASQHKRQQLEDIKKTVILEDVPCEDSFASSVPTDFVSFDAEFEHEDKRSASPLPTKSPKSVLPVGAADDASLASAGTSTSKRKKQSKRAIIADLQEKLNASRQALVSMEANASLKQRKLEMERTELNEALEAKQEELCNSTNTVCTLESKVKLLERQLRSALGADKADWLTHLDANQRQLEEQVATLEEEKKKATLERDAFHRILKSCPSCRDKLIKAKPKPAAPASTSFFASSSLGWASFSAAKMFHLDEEEVKPEDAVVVPPVQRRVTKPKATNRRASLTETFKMGLHEEAQESSRNLTKGDSSRSLFSRFSSPPKQRVSHEEPIEEEENVPSAHLLVADPRTAALMASMKKKSEPSEEAADTPMVTIPIAGDGTFPSNLDAEVSEMEQKFQDDITAMREEWAKPDTSRGGFLSSSFRNIKKQPSYRMSRKPTTTPPQSSRSNTSRTTESRHRKKRESLNSSLASLDLFFSSAALSLQDEQMDEEKSVFSRARSVQTAPVKSKSRSKKSREGKSSSRKSKSKKKDSAESNGDGSGLLSRSTLSTRQLLHESFQSLGLDEEEVL